MPQYEYQCRTCGHKADFAFRIADRPVAIPCPLVCMGQMVQNITAPTLKCSDAVNVPWIRRAMNYLEPGHEQSGNPIDTRAKYQAYLDDRGLRPADGQNLSEV